MCFAITLSSQVGQTLVSKQTLNRQVTTLFKMARQLVAALVIDELMDDNYQIKKKKRIWIKEGFAKRQQQRYAPSKLLKELRFENNEMPATSEYKNSFGMDMAAYNDLLLKVTPLIRKKNTSMRDAISANERLKATLEFLATGQSYTALKQQTLISQPALSRIIIETCEGIIKALRHYIHVSKAILCFISKKIKI